jgi:hypothetical protein
MYRLCVMLALPCQDSLTYHSTYWLTECQFVLCEPSQAMHNTVLSAHCLLSSEHLGTEIIRHPGPVFPSTNLVRRAHHSRDVVQSSSLNNPRSTGPSPLFRWTKCVLSPCSPANKCLWPWVQHEFILYLFGVILWWLHVALHFKIFYIAFFA